MFYFGGTTLSKQNGAYRRSDPINIAFEEYTPDRVVATPSLVEDAFKSHWQRQGKGAMDSNATCLRSASAEYLTFSAFKHYNGSDDHATNGIDFQMTNGSFQNVFDACANEYHIRWWTDSQHAVETNGTQDSHGPTDQWTVGGAHHEDRSTFGSHHIDRDWSVVRNAVIHHMSYYCGHPHFLYNPATDRPFQGHENDGYVGLLTFQRRSAGGC